MLHGLWLWTKEKASLSEAPGADALWTLVPSALWGLNQQHEMLLKLLQGLCSNFVSAVLSGIVIWITFFFFSPEIKKVVSEMFETFISWKSRKY